jgi:hypothetical protein
LAFQEAAGNSGSLFFWLLALRSFCPMRAHLLIAALLALSACSKGAQVDNSAQTSDDLTADAIVSNDVTAIDAVTGAAANMAADVDVNYGLDASSNSGSDATSDEASAKKPSQSAPRKSKPADNAESNSAAPATAAAATSNAE